MPELVAAKEKGIKTISYDRLILNGDSDLYVSFNNKAVGTLMGKELKRDLPDGGQIIMIQGAEEDNNVKLVYQGFMEELEGWKWFMKHIVKDGEQSWLWIIWMKHWKNIRM